MTPRVGRRLDRVVVVVPVLDGQVATARASALQLDQQDVAGAQRFGGGIDRVGDRGAADRRREHALDIGRDADDALAVVATDDFAEHRGAVRAPHRDR